VHSRTYIPEPRLFRPHPNLADEVNDAIVRSEVEGGVYLDALPEGASLEVHTENRRYFLVNQGRGRALISGHPEFCPEPVSVGIHGSTWGGSMLKVGFLGRGMRLEFGHTPYGVIVTSRIQEIKQVAG
jgi:hypothetical protein